MKEEIAARLEVAFSELGFAEPSVARLKQACHVSLRTLYKYYPSKADMVIAALAYRHGRYVKFLEHDMPDNKILALKHCFVRLHHWMQESAQNGCLSIQAISTFPSSDEIRSAVAQHKADILELFTRLAESEEAGLRYFLLHEGVSNAWPIIGYESVNAAINMLPNLDTEF